MALANFFDKISLGASQVLMGYDRKRFEEILLSQRVVIFFDDNAVNTAEGRSTLDLLVRLTARLYPNIQIESNHPGKLVKELENLAKTINPKIDMTASDKSTVCIVVGQTEYSGNIPVFYIGSDNWVTKFSPEFPVGSFQSENPFGAGAAACMGAANLFRFVFKDQLPYSEIDQNFSLSLLDFTTEANTHHLSIPLVDINEVLLVGLGAIGNAVIWALDRIPSLLGELVLVDHEKIGLSNLQRYILTDQESINLSKVDLVKDYMKGTKLTLAPVPFQWNEYIHKRNNWRIETILTCLDNAPDRILIQGSLPRKLFNAWTQNENLGVSRHADFVETPCLCCLYFPNGIKKSRSQEIADNLNLSDQEGFIREYLANNKFSDELFIRVIAAANNISEDELKPFLGYSIDNFYSEFVCGGVLMKLNGGEDEKSNRDIEIPSAFESAMAGILLAAELIKDKLQYQPSNPVTSTRFNLIRSIGKYLNFSEKKRTSCICIDKEFLNAYKAKWPVHLRH